MADVINISDLNWGELNKKRDIIYGDSHAHLRKKKPGRSRTIVGKYTMKTRNDLNTIRDNFDGVMKSFFDGTLTTILPTSAGRHAFYVLIDERVGWKDDAAMVYRNYHSKKRTELSKMRMEKLKKFYKKIFKEELKASV